jgi:uncharacterized protein YbbC (DUF1343 family)
MFSYGLDVLLNDQRRIDRLKGKRVALLAHPASTNIELRHSVDLLHEHPDINLTCAFGPQHGLKGDKQDNMVETETEIDPVYKIPIFSLYGEVRRPTEEMLQHFDVLLYDLQDVGCRIYTFLTTLVYLLEDCAASGKSVWVLDRPNPAGREIEGMTLQDGWYSFVGGVPSPMRHGMTPAELAKWYRELKDLDVELEVVPMEGYRPEEGPGYGWPLLEVPFVNPSPNLSTMNSIRIYCGTVLLEGTHLSEGRGTTTALELFGAPDFPTRDVLRKMGELESTWVDGAMIRHCYFEPTFHKHEKKLCEGIMLHTDVQSYEPSRLKPYRFVALALKALRLLRPDYEIWRKFHYEYEKERMAFDLLNGSDRLRLWVDDPSALPQDLETILKAEEDAWRAERAPHLIY